MGGVVRSVVKSVKKVGEGAIDIAKGTANTAYGVATLDVDKAKRGIKQQAGGFKSQAEVGLGIDALKSSGRELQRGIANISGAKAAQDQLNMQNELARREARRQALMSDAMAREAGGEEADVRLGSGSRKRRGAGSISTGVAGTGNSRQTGVQG